MFLCVLTDWFSNQEPQVKAAIIIGSVTLVTVCLGFFIKDYLIPIRLEKRKAKIERVSVFRNYRTPLKDSALSFKRRLDEIFRTRAHILWKDNPANDFYNYKLISTNYRLCSLLGWIYAFRKEESYLQVPSKKLRKQIMVQLDAFSTSLADGQGVEMDVAKRLLVLLNIDAANLQEGVVEKFSVEIDHLIQKAIASENKHVLADASEENHDTFLSSLATLIKDQMKREVDQGQLRELNVIDEASIRLGLIYRDWQQGIGDLMIKERGKDNGRSYDVISFREFENMIVSADTSGQLWLNRTMRLFENLDVSRDNRADNRIDQLKRINVSLGKLITALDKCKL